MSADNGVYILCTEGPEYRVRHLQAVENVYWDDEKKEECDNPDVHIKNAREMWNNCKVFTDRMQVFEEARRIYNEIMSDDFCPVCEYGICTILVPRKF